MYVILRERDNEVKGTSLVGLGENENYVTISKPDV